MLNLHLELEKLKNTLRAKGFDDALVEKLVAKAETEINLALRERMDEAMEQAVQTGVEKRSPEFINELRPRPDAFELQTESSITDFSDPPYPMLDKLLASGAKPMKDGSGVYKVVPVGSPSKKPRPPIHTNIFDAQKAMMVERVETAAKQYNSIAPGESKFRTATSKQSRSTSWILPATDKNFTDELKQINDTLGESHDVIVNDIIRSYEEGF